MGRCWCLLRRNVERELINHKTLLHPNIIRFKEVFVTSTHLGIVMEYAAGGELFDRIVKAGRFSEDEARYFFQQLISGVEFCHSQVTQPTLQLPLARYHLALQPPRELGLGMLQRGQGLCGSALSR